MPLCDYVGYMFLSAYTEMYFVSITFFLIYWEVKGCGINISSNQERVKIQLIIFTLRSKAQYLIEIQKQTKIGIFKKSILGFYV